MMTKLGVVVNRRVHITLDAQVAQARVTTSPRWILLAVDRLARVHIAADSLDSLVVGEILFGDLPSIRWKTGPDGLHHRGVRMVLWLVVILAGASS